MKGSDIRIKLLTLKHQIHQHLLEFLASPNAPIYLKVIGVCLVFFLFVLLLQIVSLLWTLISYHRDPVAYLREYYDPLTPRHVDTSDFRTSEENVFDLEAYKEELFKLNEFNTYLSDQLPINRKHKDPRSESCRIAAKRLPPDSELAHTSIIIVMYNEELSALLRTLVSIVLNTPMDSVKEIIIVDDKSSRDELGARLDTEMAQFPFVKIIRNTKREGLIRSRIIASKAAQGKVLIFLDSHVEVMVGWYSTIVARVMEDRKTVVCPVIATIDHTTLKLVSDKYTGIWGAWDWDMSFRWRAIPPRELQRRGFDDSTPIRTPAMSGGIFAIDKEYFFELGAYDPGMKIWGAENLELSFRIWMCGGALEINTCSYVGHVFRRSGLIVQTVTGETALQQNTKRVVDVWLDEYKDAFYAAVPSNKNVEGGDVVSRVLLRQRLKCRSFAWYLRQVFPDQPRPERDFVGYGEVKGPSDTCLDNLGPGVGHRVGVYSCHGKGQNQFWKLMASGELVSDNLCLDGDGESPRKIVLYECHGLKGNQQWFITEENVVMHGGSGKCLTHDGKFLQLLPCDFGDDRFKWHFAAMSADVLKKFHVLYAKQFGYTTKAEQAKKDEEKRKREEELAKKRAEKAKEKELQEKEKQKKEAEEEAARKEAEKKEKEKEKEAKEREAREAEKRQKDEEEFRQWRAEKQRLEEEAKNSKGESDEKKKYEEELRRKREEEKKKAEEEQKRKDQEAEERRKFEEEKRLRDEKEAEERRLAEERKKFEEEKRLKEEKEAEERRLAKEKEEEEKGREEEKSEDEDKLDVQENADEEEKESYPDEDNDANKDSMENQADENPDSLQEKPDENDEDLDSKSDQQEDDDVDMKEFLAWKAAQKKKNA